MRQLTLGQAGQITVAGVVGQVHLLAVGDDLDLFGVELGASPVVVHDAVGVVVPAAGAGEFVAQCVEAGGAEPGG